VLATSVYGATDELHQLFVPQRSTELSDVVADSLGAALAAWVWLKASIRWRWLR
jgi:VanZ family protein